MEAGDLSSALNRRAGRIIAQGPRHPHAHGSYGLHGESAARGIPAARMHDGDVWLLNLPEVAAYHLPDVKAVRPVFFEGRLVAFA